MPVRGFSDAIDVRFLARQAIADGAAQAAAAVGPVIDTVGNEGGVTFYAVVEAFTSGAIALDVETADDAGFTENVEVLTRDHYIEQPTVPVPVDAVTTPGTVDAVKVGVFATRRFVRLRRATPAAATMTVTFLAAIMPDLRP